MIAVCVEGVNVGAAAGRRDGVGSREMCVRENPGKHNRSKFKSNYIHAGPSIRG